MSFRHFYRTFAENWDLFVCFGFTRKCLYKFEAICQTPISVQCYIAMIFQFNMRNQRRSLSYVVYLYKRIISFTLRLFFMKSHAGDWYIYDSSLIDFKTNFLSKIIKTKHKTFRKRKDKAFSWNFLFKNQWLWPSARHFKEVTVTLSQVTVTLKWQADGQGH